MDYFAAGGTDEGLSLQDMIENDFRSNFAEHGEKIGGQLSSVHQLSNGDYLGEVNDGGAINVDLSETGKPDLSWIHGMSFVNGHAQEMGSPENTDPNLLVDPQTGMPISEASPGQGEEGSGAGISPRDAMTGHTASASQTLNRVNTVTALAASRVIHTAQGQFITIPTTVAAAASATPITRIYVPASAPASPLRQHLQNITQAPVSPMSLDYVPNSPKTPKANKTNTKVYPKPVYSYSCLIAMALKNSETGCLPVSEIYNFMTENFPYFKTAPDGWKNSVRHNLSLNKCFEKIENPKSNGNTKKGCLWTMNPAKIEKMDEEIAKWRKKDPISIKKSMSKPEVLDQLEKGNPHCGSPRHPGMATNNSTPSTPTRSHAQNNNNNNNSKLEGDLISLSNSHSVARAVRNLSNITGNFNVIELKPETVQASSASNVQVEEHSSLSNLTSDDLNILESGFTLDPTLSDLALQNGLFDDFNHDDLAIDIPGTASPLSFTFTSTGLSSSPLTIQTSNAVVKEESASVMFSSAISSAVSTPSDSKPLIARTISAPT